MLSQFRRAEENNYLASAQRLGETLSLADAFHNTYLHLNDLLRQTKDPPNEIQVASIFLLAAEYELGQALLDSMRGRLTDAGQHNRRAVELAAFAARVKQAPDLAKVWIEASQDEGSYDEYVRLFRGKKIFPDDDELLKQLGERFSHTSKQFHASVYSVANRTKIEVIDDERLEFSFEHFEISEEDPTEPARTFLFTLDTHLKILAVFRRIFAKQLGPRLAEFDREAQALADAFVKERERWRPVVAPREKVNE